MRLLHSATYMFILKREEINIQDDRKSIELHTHLRRVLHIHRWAHMKHFLM